ncbi:DoxX family protein [Ectobacillus panaciterrae]|uniref:DoxX family protein n=1 Tax=Ectobacillus panaciterrae TaxID=363872 RepID=UPI000418FA91|nr:DoxX family protein [Ectobacillus panaciterrae]
MKWTTRVVQGLLVIGFLMFGFMKLTGNAMQVQAFTKVYGYSVAFMYVVGALEVLGALGLLIGYWKPKLAAFASGGLVLLMAGAAFTHLKAGQGMGIAIMPLIFLVLSLLVFIGRLSALKNTKQ